MMLLVALCCWMLLGIVAIGGIGLCPPYSNQFAIQPSPRSDRLVVYKPVGWEVYDNHSPQQLIDFVRGHVAHL